VLKLKRREQGGTMVEMQVVGGKDVIEFMKKFPVKMWDSVDHELLKICNETRNEVIKRMRDTVKDTTKPAQRQKSGRSHYPSKEGHPPAIDSGNLIASITIESNKQFHEFFVGTIGTIYAVYLEDGTRPHTIKIKTRKVLSDTFQFYGKQVKHPGFKPRPVWGPVQNEIGETLFDRIKRRIESEV